MSHHEYRTSQKLAADDVPFYALIMAAMRRADTYNLDRLRRNWPQIWAELEERYHAPGGKLKDD